MRRRNRIVPIEKCFLESKAALLSSKKGQPADEWDHLEGCGLPEQDIAYSHGYRAPMTQQVLVTDRLILRPYVESDWIAAHIYGCDPEISQHQTWGPNSEADTQAFIHSCVEKARQPEEYGHFYAITMKCEGTLIGGCNLSPTNRGEREAMLGYTIDRAYWNRGYTTEAATALLGLAFGQLGVHRVISWCTPENIGSWRVMEKAGMRREGHEREAAWFKGAWRDWLRYAVLDHEWESAQSEGQRE